MAVPTELSAREPGFDDALARLAREAAGDGSLCILFDGGTVEERQQALARLKEATEWPVHQVGLDTLFHERMEVTQGSIREVFDASGEAPAILCLEGADEFFRDQKRQSAREDLDPDALTALTYLFDRIKAFAGMVVLCFSSEAYLREARPHAQAVVTFRGAGR